MGLNDKNKLKELFQNTPELKQYNIFNKIYIKHKENIFFFQTVNDYIEMESLVRLMKFNLITLKKTEVLRTKIQTEDTEVHTLNDEDKLDVKQPFGIS